MLKFATKPYLLCIFHSFSPPIRDHKKIAGRKEIKLILREEEGYLSYLPDHDVRYVAFGSMGVLHVFGYVTFYLGYCIGYYIDVLRFVARTPDTRNTTAPRRSKISRRSSVTGPAKLSLKIEHFIQIM